MEQTQKKRTLDIGMLKAMMDNEKREKAQRYRILNQYARKGQIVFAGSSLMEQFPVYEFLLDDSLPYTIYNRGIGGSTTAELLQNMDACIYDLEPGVVLLNIGTNDLNDPACTLEALEEQYAQVVTEIQNRLPQTQICLLAYYPVNPDAANSPHMEAILRSRTNEKIRKANERIEAMARRYGIRFLDLNDDITDEKGNLMKEVTVEGMHMYANGYRRIWTRLLPVLRELVKCP